MTCQNPSLTFLNGRTYERMTRNQYDPVLFEVGGIMTLGSKGITLLFEVEKAVEHIKSIFYDHNVKVSFKFSIKT